MVWKCCICKLTSGEVENVSFHSFPKKEDLRSKWIIAIGREVSKSSSVCSRHFEECNFQYKVFGDGVRRYLSTNAVPSLKLSHCYDRKNLESMPEPEITKPAEIVSQTVEIQLHEQYEQSRKNDSVLKENNLNDSLPNQSLAQFEEYNCSMQNQPLIEANEDNCFIQNQRLAEVNENNFLNCDLILHHTSEYIQNSSEIKHVGKQTAQTEERKTATKRKSSKLPLTGAKRFCNPRSVGDLRRDDFTSDITFQIVQKYVKETKKMLKTKNQQVKRLTKKIDNLQDLLSYLEKYNILSEEGINALQMRSSTALHEIFKNSLVSNKPTSYSTAVKEFACTLLFYSASAYKHVRENFFNCLPHPQTVRRWFSNFQLNPGISQSVLLSVRNMIEEERQKGKELQFGIQLDEMSIKKQMEIRNNVCYGMVDLGIQKAEIQSTEEASYALVVMLVCLNGHFKTPIAYYFIKSLSGKARANLLLEILMTLHENGISDVRAITFDGAVTNFAMVAKLGATLHSVKEECSLQHPITSEPIVIIPDACHMLKLIRNCFSEYKLMDENENEIDWSYIKKLVDFQENEKLHTGTKIRRRHVDFQREKMKVKLAAQILSVRVANALTYMELKYPKNFFNANATSTFCKNMNDTFDILNSRRKFVKNDSQSCFTIDNINEMEDKINALIRYISSLKIILDDGQIKSILESKRKTGFWGMITAMKSILKLSKYLFNNNLMTYVLSYKLSQDHLETFFSCIRKQGGFNNNPTCFQFICAYKKLVSHVNSIIPHEGNCTPQDCTGILKIKEQQNQQTCDILTLKYDHDYIGTNGWCWNEYRNDVVTYIAGSIVRSLTKTIKCELCCDCLESASTTCDLIKIKDRGGSDEVITEALPDKKKIKKKSGLLFPSPDVVSICKTAEQVLRSTQNLFSRKNIIDILVVTAKTQLYFLPLFTRLDNLMEKTVTSTHKVELIDKILKKYFKIRLYAESRNLQDHIQRIRTFHNRLVVFKNQ